MEFNILPLGASLVSSVLFCVLLAWRWYGVSVALVWR